jgi:iron complex outermembrane recepter protein
LKHTPTRMVRLLALAFGGGFVLAAAPAAAQQAAPQAASAQQQLETVTITGSNIRRTDTETASPVQVITRDAIARSGKQNVAEVIQTVSANNQGSIPGAFTGGFAAGSAGVSLRGLGVNATLVLVNGRRMAPYGLADDGQRTFVDLNAIPLEAIERIEVLKDGASAIYGSDAIGGVVNLILRRDFKGVIAGASYGETKYRDGNVARAFSTYGIGDPATDRYNINVTVEGSHEGRIRQKDRPDWLGSYDLRPWGLWDNRRGAAPRGGTLGAGGLFPDGSGPGFSSTTPWGVVRTPGGTQSDRTQLTNPNRVGCEVSPISGLCIFDQIEYADVQPETDRLNLVGRGSFNFTPETTGYVEFGAFHSNIKALGNTPSGTSGAIVFDPRPGANPLVIQNATLPANHPDNPTGVARTLSLLTTDVGPRSEEIDNKVLRLIAGLTGERAGWSYDFGTGYLESKLKAARNGYLRFSAFQEALNNGSYRINNPSANSAGVYASIAPTLATEAKNSVSFVDGKISREFPVAGIPLGVAFGIDWRQEKTDSPPVPFTDVADILGLGFAAFNSKRDVTAVFTEVSAPITQTLELNGALRFDKYSDYGNSTTPKIGFKFSPSRQLTLRGTYAESFRAPGPAENGNSSSAGFAGIILVSRGNPDVKPEEAKSFTLGVIAEPWTGGSASIDYYQVKRTNEIIGSDQAAILRGVNCGTNVSTLIPGAQPGTQVFCDQDSEIAGAFGLYQNANKTETSGIDFDVRQRFDLGNIGRFTAGVTWTHIRKFDRTLQDGTRFEYAGTHGPFVLSAAGGTPQNRATFAFNLDRGPWAATWTANYVSSMAMIDHKGETLVDNGDGTFTTSTGESSSNGPVTGVCGNWYPTQTSVVNGVPIATASAPVNGCRVSSFTSHDLTVKYSGFKNLDLVASVLNVFNEIAPLDPYTYGGVNYNPVFHQAGAVGRFFSIGFRYRFQ